MEHIIHPGDIRPPLIHKTRAVPIFVKIEYTSGKLSLTGVVGPDSRGNCAGGAGQINMGFAHRNPADNDDRHHSLIQPSDIRFAPGWNTEMWFTLLDAWKAWHLNDMRAGCQHQRDWPTTKKVEVIKLNWGDAFHELRRKIEDGDEAAFDEYRRVKPIIYAATIGMNLPLHPDLWTDDIRAAIDAGYLRKDKSETKALGWLHPSEHPEGLLTKPCAVCGYKYGSDWLKEDVPADVINWLFGLPKTDITPAWV